MPSRACRTILVVEDDPLVRLVVSEVLADAGFEVVEASHAAEALDLLHARANDVHGLFTDVHMPGPIDGVALAHAASRCWPWLGLLVASGRLTPAAHDLPPGCRFLQKPYHLEHVVHHVRDMTAGAQPGRHGRLEGILDAGILS